MIFVLIASLSKEGSDESAHTCSLIRAFASHILKFVMEVSNRGLIRSKNGI